MKLYPAIDIMDGKCVRLIKGEEHRKTIYSNDPIAVAKNFEEMGAKHLHVVDLDGAFRGYKQNESVIEAIAKSVNIPVQVGGGIRKIDDVNRLFDLGVSRVVLGTVMIEDPSMFELAVMQYGHKIVAGIDCKDGIVVIKGWVEKSGISALELAERVKKIGVSRVVYTDVAKDGMMQGPNMSGVKKMQKESGLKVIASGGVSCLDDLIKLNEAGVYGAIIGKAFYEGTVDIKEACALLED